MTAQTTPEQLRNALEDRMSADGELWLTGSLHRIHRDPVAVRTLFPAAGRRCGRGSLVAHDEAGGVMRGWTVDDAARALMMTALPLSGSALVHEVTALYRYGDAAEKRGVLRGLGPLDTARGLGDGALPLVHDGLRTNDTRLITAALGTYGARHLEPPGYRHGVLKCVFVGIALDDITGLDERADGELARMLTDYAREREAAGRDVPPDVWRVVGPFTTHAPTEA